MGAERKDDGCNRRTAVMRPPPPQAVAGGADGRADLRRGHELAGRRRAPRLPHDVGRRVHGFRLSGVHFCRHRHRHHRCSGFHLGDHGGAAVGFASTGLAAVWVLGRESRRHKQLVPSE